MGGIHQVLSTNIVTAAGGGGYVPPDYVSSGLTAYYDPANPLSYAGSGSTLTDLSGNGINGTIVGATYTDNTYFTLDGVNDYICLLYTSPSPRD